MKTKTRHIYKGWKLAGFLFTAILGVAVAIGLMDRPQSTNPKERPLIQSELESGIASIAPFYIQNQGQISGDIQFYFPGKTHSFYLMKDRAMVQSQYRETTDTVREITYLQKFVNSNPNVRVVGREPLDTQFNYFKGKNVHTKIPTFQEVVYQDLYPNIDLKYHFNRGRVEYTYLVRPKADPTLIRFSFDGIQKLELGEDGALTISTAKETFIHHAPIAYQKISGRQVAVATHYEILNRSTHTVQVAVEAYDPAYALIIDPLTTLQAATYLNSDFSSEYYIELVRDGSGNIYIAGGGADVPTTVGAYDTVHGSLDDIIVAKFNSTLTTLSACTYIGGDGADDAYGIALDSGGNVVIAGASSGADYPVTAGVYDTSHNTGNDAVVSILSSDLSTLRASTYIGGSGSDVAYAMTLDGSDNVYVTGTTFDSTTDFPTTAGAYDTAQGGGGLRDVFVAKLNAALTSLTASTFLGGGFTEIAYDITLDGSGNVYITGEAGSGYPAVTGNYDTTHAGTGASFDVFASKLSGDLTTLLASTFMGNSYADRGEAIALDSGGNIYIVGHAGASYPVTGGAYDTTHGGGSSSTLDMIISKLNSDMTSLVASTYLGSTGADKGLAVAIDTTNSKLFACGSASSGFPTVAGGYDTSHNGSTDIFVLQMTLDLVTLDASTFIGGSAADECQSIILNSDGTKVFIGGTSADGDPDTPTTVGTYDPAHSANAGQDLYIAILDGKVSNTAPVANAGPDQSNKAEAVTVTLNGAASSDADGNSLTYSWSQTVGTAVTLSSSTAVQPTFTSPDVSANETLRFSLTVNDGTANSAADTVDIGINAKPTANAQSLSTALNVARAITVAGSDPNSEALSFAIVANPSYGALSGTLPTITYTPNTNFAGADSFSFRATDGIQNSDTASISLSVGSNNQIPTANAGVDQTLNPSVAASASLSGVLSSDPDGSPITYSWSQISGPGTVVFSGGNWPTGSAPVFSTAIKSGTYVFRLTVNDGLVNSNPDDVNITITNIAPVAALSVQGVTLSSGSYGVYPGDQVTLTAAGSSDLNNQALSYTHSKTSGPAVPTLLSNGPTATFMAPTGWPSGTLITFNVLVSDGAGGTASAQAVVLLLYKAPTFGTVSYTPPPTTTTTTSTSTTGVAVQLSGSGTQVYSGSTTYQYTLQSAPTGSSATITDSTSATASATFDKAGSYVVQACVSDGTTNSCSNQTVTVPNYAPIITIANAYKKMTYSATSPIFEIPGITIADQNKDSLTSVLECVTCPGTLNWAAGNPFALDTTIASKKGTYTIRPKTYDGTTYTYGDEIEITIPNNKPKEPAPTAITFGEQEKGAAKVEYTTYKGEKTFVYNSFSPTMAMKNMTFSDADGDNPSYGYTVLNADGTANAEQGLIAAGSGELALKIRKVGKSIIRVTVSDGAGGTTTKDYPIYIPPPTLSDLPMIITGQSAVGSDKQEVTGSVRSPVTPVVTVNGTKASAVTLTSAASVSVKNLWGNLAEDDGEENDVSLSKSIEDEGWIGTSKAVDTSTYDTYTFKATTGVGSDPNSLSIAVGTDVDGSTVSLVSKSVGISDSDWAAQGSSSGSGSGCQLKQGGRGTISIVGLLLILLPLLALGWVRRFHRHQFHQHSV